MCVRVCECVSTDVLAILSLSHSFLPSPWWCFATTDFKLVYLSHRFHFASFLLFIVQLFKLFVVIQTAQHSPISVALFFTRSLSMFLFNSSQNARSCLAFTSNYSKYSILEVWLKYKHLRKHGMHILHTHALYTAIFHYFRTGSIFLSMLVHWKIAYPIPSHKLSSPLAFANHLKFPFDSYAVFLCHLYGTIFTFHLLLVLYKLSGVA